MTTTAEVVPIALRRTRCTICTLPRESRKQIESSLMAGSQLRGTANAHGVTESSLRRHVLRHLRVDLQMVGELALRTRASELIGELAESLEEMRLSRAIANESGNVRAAVAASAEHRVLLMTLADKLGITKQTVITEHAELVDLARALGRTINAHPEVGELVAANVPSTSASLRGHLAQATESAREAQMALSAAATDTEGPTHD